MIGVGCMAARVSINSSLAGMTDGVIPAGTLGGGCEAGGVHMGCGLGGGLTDCGELYACGVYAGGRYDCGGWLTGG